MVQSFILVNFLTPDKTERFHTKAHRVDILGTRFSLFLSLLKHSAWTFWGHAFRCQQRKKIFSLPTVDFNFYRENKTKFPVRSVTMADTHENYEPLTKQMRTPASPPIFLVVMHIHENYESLTKQMRTPASPPPLPFSWWS